MFEDVEAMHMTRKGQVNRLDGKDAVGTSHPFLLYVSFRNRGLTLFILLVSFLTDPSGVSTMALL